MAYYKKIQKVDCNMITVTKLLDIYTIQII